MIEVAGLDRPGLLFELTNSLSDLNLDITSAHITTFGEKAVDVFYVTDLTNKKITSPQRAKGHPRAPAGGPGRECASVLRWRPSSRRAGLRAARP